MYAMKFRFSTADVLGLKKAGLHDLIGPAKVYILHLTKFSVIKRLV